MGMGVQVQLQTAAEPNPAPRVPHRYEAACGCATFPYDAARGNVRAIRAGGDKSLVEITIL